jgi:alkylation response protein AidB-like acyl-CoA dehydrogenase
MPFELTPTTPAGHELVSLTERLAAEIAPRAAAHDRDATFPFESFALLRTQGFFTAPVPVELGGLGATSVHDVLVASNRLARSDASLAIGANMHFVYVLNLVRRWERTRKDAFATSLRELVEDGTVFAAAISEPGQDITRPATTATRTDGGWLLRGEKVFCTMSPAADVFYVAVSYDGLYGYASVPRDAAGVVVHDDWDALGMRASGSNSVSFEDVVLAPVALRGGFPLGDAVAYMERNLASGLFHAAAALGVAETAHASTVGSARDEAIVARQVVDLAACAGALSRAATLIDRDAGDVPTLFAEAQAAKLLVGEAAVRVVDRALTLSGGAGYRNGHPLSRAYRDVRAASFMHPLGANRAPELLAHVALGREPELH